LPEAARNVTISGLMRRITHVVCGMTLALTTIAELMKAVKIAD
jgi:hypothetical protein